MRILVVAILLAPAALHAQLGVPLSSLPGVAPGVPAEVGGAMQGGIQGIAIPTATLNRLMGGPTGTAASGGNIGAQIEQSFFGGNTAATPSAASYGLSGGAARTVTGESLPSASGGSSSVKPSGTGVQLPTAQQLMPANLIPGYQSLRGTGSASPTGVGNVFTGSGQPRPGAGP
jgi:hypothetical protein